MSTIDVIIAIKDRPEITQSVQSLWRSPHINQILLCDGGSTTAASQQALASLAHLPQVQVLPRWQPGFNKGYLLNQGLLQAQADFCLVSDADILWNEATLCQFHQQWSRHPDTLYCIEQVVETQPQTIALKRDRYTYHLTPHRDTLVLTIQPVTEGIQHRRPGCGLLGMSRAQWRSLRGYKEVFQGWGWEDQDLLIRAQILGLPLEAIGQVHHLSHGDEQRNPFHDHAPPSQTRNRNLIVCLGELVQHQLWGDLPGEDPPPTGIHSVQIQLPESLRIWLDEFCCHRIPDHALSRARAALANAVGLVASPGSTDAVEPL